MTKMELRRETYQPQGDETVLAALAYYVGAHGATREAHDRQTFFLGNDRGEKIDIPEVMVRALRHIASAMGQGMAVTVIPQAMSLTTQQAAEILGVSRPTLIRMLNIGHIPYERIGAHRRLLLGDVLKHREQRRSAQYAALEVTSIDIDADDDFQRVIENLRDVRKQVAVRRHAK